MAKANEAEEPTAVESLFEKALSDPEKIPSVSQYVKTGKRWDSTHKDWVNELLVIHSFKTIRTKYGDAALVQLDARGEQHEVLFGSLVLQEQLADLEPNLPVLAQIQKPGRAYLFFDPTPEMVAEYQKKYM